MPQQVAKYPSALCPPIRQWLTLCSGSPLRSGSTRPSGRPRNSRRAALSSLSRRLMCPIAVAPPHLALVRCEASGFRDIAHRRGCWRKPFSWHDDQRGRPSAHFTESEAVPWASPHAGEGFKPHSPLQGAAAEQHVAEDDREVSGWRCNFWGGAGKVELHSHAGARHGSSTRGSRQACLPQVAPSRIPKISRRVISGRPISRRQGWQAGVQTVSHLSVHLGLVFAIVRRCVSAHGTTPRAHLMARTVCGVEGALSCVSLCVCGCAYACVCSLQLSSAIQSCRVLSWLLRLCALQCVCLGGSKFVCLRQFHLSKSWR